MTPSSLKSGLAALLLLGVAANSFGQVTLTNTDTIGSSSFAPGYNTNNWSDGNYPHLSATYSTLAFGLRTPADSPAFIFQGASLTIPTGGSMNYKGTAAAGITVTNLILAGGSVGNGQGGSFTLSGNVSLTANSFFNPSAGRTINVAAPISGAYALTNLAGTLILSGSNSLTGGLQVPAGLLQIANAYALGNPSNNTPVTVASGANLDLNGYSLVSTSVVQIAGSGPGGGVGALGTPGGGYMNFGYGSININNVSLAGNASIGNNGGGGTTFSGGSDFTIGNSGLGLSGNGYVLTKVGANNVLFLAPALSAPSAVNIQGGGIFFDQYTTAGLGLAPITLYNNAFVQTVGITGVSQPAPPQTTSPTILRLTPAVGKS